MKFIVLITAIIAGSLSAQSFKISKSGMLVDTKECLSFKLPKNWWAISGAPIPTLYNFAPGRRPLNLQSLPIGASSINLGPENDSYDHSNSIEDLMRIRRRAQPFTSVREIRYPQVTGITRAVEVHWTEAYPGLPPLQVTAVLFTFRELTFIAYLSFYQADKRAAQYRSALADVFKTFRPSMSAKCLASSNK